MRLFFDRILLILSTTFITPPLSQSELPESEEFLPFLESEDSPPKLCLSLTSSSPGLKETLRSTSMHCLSLMERIRLDDDYDMQDLTMNKHINFSPAGGLPPIKDGGSPSTRAESRSVSPASRDRSPDSDYPEVPLSERGRLRKERRGLSPEVLLAAEDLSLRRKRKKRKQANLFRAGLDSGLTGAQAISVRQSVADRLGMAYLPPEDLVPRVENLKKLASNQQVKTIEELDKSSPRAAEFRNMENALFYSRYGLKVSGRDKIKYVPKKSSHKSELQATIDSVKVQMKKEGTQSHQALRGSIVVAG